MSHEQIAYGIRQLSLEQREFAPSPGQFREFCLRYRAPEPPRQKALPDASERESAWRRTRGLMIRRLYNMTPSRRPGSVTERAIAETVDEAVDGTMMSYAGEFPCQVIVDLVQIDGDEREVIRAGRRMQPLIDFDQRVFDALRREFNREWILYAMPAAERK